jgi:uncharacterized protein (DUF433 family)
MWAQQLRPVKPPNGARPARSAIAETETPGGACYTSAMKRYRLDPSNPWQLLPEEARQLDAAPIDYSDIPPLVEIDWTGCPDVERDPARCSGAWCVKGTRILVDGILDNAADCTPEEIATEIFEGIAVDQVRCILDFALAHPPPLMSGEGEATALLLAMVLHHCGTAGAAELDSYGVPVNADAIEMLREDGYIEIIEDDCGDRITGNLTFFGRLLMATLRAERERKAAASWRNRPAEIERQ